MLPIDLNGEKALVSGVCRGIGAGIAANSPRPAATWPVAARANQLIPVHAIL